MMSYRPEGWKGYHCLDSICTECSTNPVDCNKHYEAGADAMLEGLKEQTSHPQEVRDAEGEKLGILVFIPEER